MATIIRVYVYSSRRHGITKNKKDTKHKNINR